MKKLLIFSSGIIVGVIGTPVAIMYVPPVKKAFAVGVSNFLRYVVTEEAKKDNSKFLDLVDEAYIAHLKVVAEQRKAGDANI